MKKLILFIALSASALVSHAQTAQALADNSFAQKDYSKAFDYYAQAVKVDTGNVKDYRRMGFCFMNFEGQELNATRYFAKALKIVPNDPVANYYMGVVFMDQAKQSKDAKTKSDFKAKAALYLKRAISYGSEDAKTAQRDLNSI